ncbi:hypothetical protein [Gracilimonas mengyeensis]|uniref:Uncharacterized protein n=1 Tax=Gracilimonas mengyeensis TaxID=1302730 RepID=A0A521EKE8_9BACT|nr:hypothetical protein [Gracilimonas mengyeensis]SMO83951.1 hypothetical protein SAMN06265219_11281 [Gracilimonas mengyeensis]
MKITRYGLTVISILFFVSISSTDVLAQFPYERLETEGGDLRLSISNYGIIGKADVRNNPQSGASMRYPANTGTEHLFEAGIWVGAYLNGQMNLSSAAITDGGGYQTGASGFEFTASAPLLERGNETGTGISDHDIIAEYTDRNIIVPGTTIPIQNHTQPIGADVRMESYNWGFPFTENFSVIKYTITNNSHLYDNVQGGTWDSVYVGMYADLIVRDVNNTQDQGTAFFNKGGIGYLDSLYTTYAFDAGSNDNPSLNSYGAISLLGSIYRDEFFHPLNEELEERGYTPPLVGPSYWKFSQGTGIFRGPENDLDRYERMASQFDFDANQGGSTAREALRTDGQDANGNYISMISIGPYPEVAPGESFDVYFVFTAALKPDQFQGLAGKEVDTPESRTNLVSSINSALRVIQGNDRNNNNQLDPGEDTNETGTLDRFIFPTPPDNPTVRLELNAGEVTLYWDRKAENSIDPVTSEQDFEGYKIYRSDLGDDLNPNPRVIREFDTPGNDIGFNTGFDEVRLEEPVTFEGDSTEYWYKYEVTGLLSGWQYQFSVTSFDYGSEVFELEPLETSPNVNAVRVFPGTSPNQDFDSNDKEHKVGVYPNPYRVNAAWDGAGELNRKMMFYNLPSKAEIRIYTLAGDIVAELEHNSDTYRGDIDWFENRSGERRVFSGGEHAWDILSESNQTLRSGLYLYTVKDMNGGSVQTGKFVIIK